MNAKHVNAICRATEFIFVNHFGVDVKPLNPRVQQNAVPSNQVSVILGINGQLNGQIICSIDEQTAKNIVGVMMGGMTIEALDDMGWSAIQEFGNWVAGTTATELSKEDVIIDVTPPVINEGASHFRSNRLFITVPLETRLGLIDIHISVKEPVAS
ncbi:chemotaxis protein CheX [Anaerobacillus isosaccharinicus]|uniref:Chemotaxis protein CheX n=1 Tax=Anaerobacillus isosaccharinicus TaxID=1532552 RepID=A0A1S2MDG8_9BACI|nr:chemotaxis protein CheX [Anaerobacillus isosaccharinicus]MBA5585135.1 chemotaxis protein CheX [Anaerobacillus isosaccharinicus]QOY36522.1 chemotaxis protein CheX [Anaerobacillus isosaccharinicus]